MRTTDTTPATLTEQIAAVLLATKDPAGPFPVVRAGCAMTAAEAVVAVLEGAEA